MRATTMIPACAALAVLLVAACGQKPAAPPPPPPPAPAEVDPALWAGLSRVESQALRAAMMRAQVEVAHRLVREDAGGAASTHVLRVIGDLYAPAKAAYALEHESLDEKAFQAGADAAASGASAEEMRKHTDDMLRAIDKLSPRNGQWSKAGTVKKLLKEIAHQYSAGVQSGIIVNEERYQDAFGLAIVAQEIVEDAVDDGVAKDPSRSPELRREAEGLVNMFPSASAPNAPADAGEVLAQINRVELAFPGME